MAKKTETEKKRETADSISGEASPPLRSSGDTGTTPKRGDDSHFKAGNDSIQETDLNATLPANQVQEATPSPSSTDSDSNEREMMSTKGGHSLTATQLAHENPSNSPKSLEFGSGTRTGVIPSEEINCLPAKPPENKVQEKPHSLRIVAVLTKKPVVIKKRELSPSEENVSRFDDDCVAAFISGSISHSILAPLERIKILMQTQSISSTGQPTYSGVIDCGRKVVARGGLTSLWAGNTAGILGMPSIALNFALKDVYRSKMREHVGENSAMANFLAGSAAGCTTLGLFYPLEIAHILMLGDADVSTAGHIKATYTVLQKLYQRHGVSGLYTGFGSSLRSTFIKNGIYFGAYDSYKQTVLQEYGPQPLYTTFLAAQAISSSAALISYPLDTIKKTIIMDSLQRNPRFKGFMECSRYIFQTRGLSGFYAGAAASAAKSTAAALTLVFYDKMKELCSRKRT